MACFISAGFNEERVDSSNAENDSCTVDVLPFCQCSIPFLRYPNFVAPNNEQGPCGM
jgi:hypothetical protein